MQNLASPPNPDGEETAARMLSLIASGRARSRLALSEVASLSRSTIADRIAYLLDGGLIVEHVQTSALRGRPTRRLDVNVDFAVTLAADIGETYAHLSITDLSPKLLAESGQEMDIHKGPVAMLEWILTEFHRLLSSIGRAPSDVLGLGLGLPAQIDFETGQVVAPSLMTGWEDFDIRAWIGGRLDAPVIVENEVNLMAMAEHRRFWPHVDDLFFLKAGTGIGSGIIANGRIYRGAHGAAGEIGHIQIDAIDGPLCRCGMLGCLEARASGWALARDLRAQGIPAENARDILALVRSKRPEVIQRVREAGQTLGKVAADVGCLLNPAAIIVGGALSMADDHLMVGLRGLFYQRALPLVTRGLILEIAKADPKTSVLLGAAQMVIDAEFAPDRIGSTLRRHWAAGASHRLASAV